jgi:hypothetical protein
MPLSKLVFKPGINRDQTDYASEGGWYSMDKVRFRSGFPEKIGGWTVKTFDQYEGSARSMFTWSTNNGAKLTAVGTNEKIYVNSGTSLYDITPIRVTYTSTTTPSSSNCFKTTSGSNLVEILNITAGIQDGEWVTFSGVTTAVGGVPAADFNNEFQITFVGSTPFIAVATTASSTATSTGNTAITAAFQINIGYPIVTAGYGWGAGAWSRGTWGSGSVTPIFFPARLEFFDNFNQNLLFNINAGDIYYWGYDSTFLTPAVTLQSVPGAIAVPQQVNFTLFASSGHYVALGCTNYLPSTVAGVTISTITRGGTGNLTATLTTTTAHGLSSGDYITLTGQTPAEFSGTYQITYIDATHFSYIMPVAPAGNATVMGTYVYNDYNGDYDPLLIRWANVDATIGPEPEVWQPTVTNTAGFLRLQSGSSIIAAINSRQEMLIFTDTSLTSMQFLGTTEVFGLQELSHNISIAGPNAIVGINNVVYWMGQDKFFTYSGRVDSLPCTLRQYIFSDINYNQAQIFFAGTNNQFNEIVWFYCSATSNEIDRYVIYNYSESIWYYGQLERTAWLDSGDFTNPIAAYNGWIYDQENGVDDGQPNGAAPLPISAYIQSANVDIDDGDKYMLIRRIIPDINFTQSETNNPVTGAPNTIQSTITVGVQNFPGAASATTNASGVTTARNIVTATATVDQYTNQVFVRARGRQMSFKIESNNVGTQWQLGMPRIDARPDGMRN